MELIHGDEAEITHSFEMVRLIKESLRRDARSFGAEDEQDVDVI